MPLLFIIFFFSTRIFLCHISYILRIHSKVFNGLSGMLGRFVVTGAFRHVVKANGLDREHVKLNVKTSTTTIYKKPKLVTSKTVRAFLKMNNGSLIGCIPGKGARITFFCNEYFYL